MERNKERQGRERNKVEEKEEMDISKRTYIDKNIGSERKRKGRKNRRRRRRQR